VKRSLRVLWQQLFLAELVCLACEVVVLDYGCVVVFIVVSFVKRSLSVLWQQLFLAAVFCLGCEFVVLDYGCVVVFIVV